MKKNEIFNLEELKEKLEGNKASTENSFRYKFISLAIVAILVLAYDQLLVRFLFNETVLSLFISLNIKEIFYIIIFFIGIWYYIYWVYSFFKIFIKYIKKIKNEKNKENKENKENNNIDIK